MKGRRGGRYRGSKIKREQGGDAAGTREAAAHGSSIVSIARFFRNFVKRDGEKEAVWAAPCVPNLKFVMNFDFT